MNENRLIRDVLNRPAALMPSAICSFLSREESKKHWPEDKCFWIYVSAE